MEEIDVVIVGAGFSGLAAARELRTLDIPFVVLDTYDHLGGRARSYDSHVPSDPECRFDHGAQYVGDLQNAIMEQVRELLPPDGLVNGANLRLPFPHEVMVLDGQRHCFRGSDSLFGIPGVPPDLGILSAIGMIGLLAEMTLIEISINVLEPWKGPAELLELDQIDVWSWLGQKRWVNAKTKDLLRISVEALLSVEPWEISPYYLLWYTACKGGFLNEINDNEGGPQQYWLRRGAGDLAEKYASPIRSQVRQGSTVSAIDLSGERVLVTTTSGAQYSAKRVIVAASPHTAGRIAFTPEPPPGRKQLMAQPMGKTLKCQVYYKSAFWHDSNGFSYNGYVGGANYPVLWVMDNSPPGGGAPYVLMTFTVGAQVESLGPEPSDAAIQTLVTSTLRDLFQDDRALEGSSEFIALRHYLWAPGEKGVGGGPNAIFSPGMLTGEAGRTLDQAWDDKVFFASAEKAKNLRPRSTKPHYDIFGDENLPEYDDDRALLRTSKPPFYSKYSDMRGEVGYMSGAMESGRYVAHEVAASLGARSELPARPLAEPRLVSRSGARAPAFAGELLAEVRAAVLAESKDALCARWAGGGEKFSTWLHDLVAKAALASGYAEANDPRSVLEAVRDFAERVGATVESAVDEGNNELREHLRAIDEHLNLR